LAFISGNSVFKAGITGAAIVRDTLTPSERFFLKYKRLFLQKYLSRNAYIIPMLVPKSQTTDYQLLNK